MREGVFSVHNNHRHTRDNRATGECAYHICLSVNIRASTVTGITWTLIYFEQVKCYKNMGILCKMFYRRCLFMFPYLCGRVYHFYTTKFQHAVGKFPIVVECDVFRRSYEMPLA
jgi:hypothetical protein